MKQRGFAHIVLILILLLVVAGSAYYLGTQKDKFLSKTSPTPIVQISSPVPQDETSNWKVYKDDQYKFEFKYPNNFELNKDNLSIRGEGINFFIKNPDKKKIAKEDDWGPNAGGIDSIGIDISTSTPVKTADEWMNYDMQGEVGVVSQSYLPVSKTKVGGNDAWITNGGGCCGSLRSTHVFVVNNGILFDIYLFGSTDPTVISEGLIENQETFHKMLDTFKFTQ